MRMSYLRSSVVLMGRDHKLSLSTVKTLVPINGAAEHGALGQTMTTHPR